MLLRWLIILALGLVAIWVSGCRTASGTKVVLKGVERSLILIGETKGEAAQKAGKETNLDAETKLK